MSDQVRRSEQRHNSRSRVVGRPFPRGVSGNPGGRPQGFGRRIREATRDGEQIVDFMVAVLEGHVKSATTRDRMTAAMWLADRGFGKSAEPAPEEEQLDRGRIRAAWLSLPDHVLEQIIAVSRKSLPNGPPE